MFNAAVHSLRLRVERTFAWEDKFKRLLFAIVDMPRTSHVAKLCIAVGARGMKTSALPLLTVADMDGLLTENVNYQQLGG